MARFLRRRRQEDYGYIVALLQRTYPERTAKEIRELAREEMRREEEFRRKMLARLQRDLPEALKIQDATKRLARVNALLDREKRYIEMRQEAMTDRAIAAAERASVKAVSPQGAYWKLSAHVKEHTLDCLALGEKFWPWAVLDVVHPPTHPGCRCMLYSLDEAVGAGFMGHDQVPDTADAVKRATAIAKKYKLLQEAAQPYEIEAYVEELLEEVAYSTRYPKGFAKGGEFRPRRGYAPGRRIIRKALADLIPHLLTPAQARKGSVGRWQKLNGRQVFVPEARRFEREIGGRRFVSPPGTTEVYERAGKATPVVGDMPPETRAEIEALYPRKVSEDDRWRNASTRPPLARPPESFREFADELREFALRTAAEHGDTAAISEVRSTPEKVDHSGEHGWDGAIDLAEELARDMDAAGRHRKMGEPLGDELLPNIYGSYKTGYHEALHAANPIASMDYFEDSGLRALEEGLTEEVARIFAERALAEQGQTDVLDWAYAHPNRYEVIGTYAGARAGIDRILDEAKVAPEERADLLIRLKLDADPAERLALLGDLLRDRNPDRYESDEDADLAVRSYLDVEESPVGEVLAPNSRTSFDTPRGIHPAAYESSEGTVRLGSDVTVSVLKTVAEAGSEERPGGTTEQEGRVLLRGTVIDIGQPYRDLPWLATVQTTDGRIISMVTPDEIRTLHGERPPVVAGIEIQPGMLLSYDGRADGEMSTARVQRVTRIADPTSTEPGQGWAIEALTTEDSLVPNQPVTLTASRVGGEIRATEAVPETPGPLPEPESAPQRPVRARAAEVPEAAGIRSGEEYASARARRIRDAALGEIDDMLGRLRTHMHMSHEQYGWEPEPWEVGRVEGLLRARDIVAQGGEDADLLDSALQVGPKSGGSMWNEGFQSGMRSAAIELRDQGHLDTLREIAPAAAQPPAGEQDAAEKLATLTDYLRTLSGYRTEHMGASDWHYAGYEDMVLREGKVFTELAPTPREFFATTKKECFRNAAEGALQHDDLTYVEGYAYYGGIPIHHAWLVDQQGRVYDPTWGQRDDPAAVYVGIPFSRDFLLERIIDKETYGLLFDPEGAALEEKLPAGAKARVRGGSKIPAEGKEMPEAGAQRSWEGFPFDQVTGQKPNERDTPPERTPEGDFVLYHGTSEAGARGIDAEGLKPDDLGVVGVSTTPGRAQTFAAMKKGPVLRVVIDRNWLAGQSISREVGGSGRDQFLIQAPEADVRQRRRFAGVPRSAIKEVSTHDFEGKEQPPAGGRRYARVKLPGKKPIWLRVQSETPDLLTGIEVNAEGDEIVPKGKSPEGERFTERLHVIDKSVAGIEPARMNQTYGELEIEGKEQPPGGGPIDFSHDPEGFMSWLKGLGAHQKKGKPKQPPLPKATDDGTLTIRKRAGGMNGAMFAEDADGERWLVKTYLGNEDRVATEYLANRIYAALGIRVPEGELKDVQGKPAYVYRTIDGKAGSYSLSVDEPNPALGRGFMADALLANWDVVGLEHDNLLWTEEKPDTSSDEPVRLDQGGALQMRALGGLKSFGPVPTEVWTMRSPKGQAFGTMQVSLDDRKAQAREIAEKLPEGLVDDLVDEAPFADEKMREEVRSALKARIAWMRDFADGKVEEPGPLAGKDAKAEFEQEQEMLELLPEEDTAVLGWIGGWDAVTNGFLRGGGTSLDATEEQRFVVRHMDSLLNYVHTDEDVVAFAPLPGDSDPKILVGKTLRDAGYTVMTFARAPAAKEVKAQGGGAVMRVLIPAGSHALGLKAIAGVAPEGPGDVVVKRGSRFKVVGHSKIRGVDVLDVVMIPGWSGKYDGKPKKGKPKTIPKQQKLNL